MEMTEIDHRSPNELCVIVPFGGRIDIWWYVYNYLSQMIVTRTISSSNTTTGPPIVQCISMNSQATPSTLEPAAVVDSPLKTVMNNPTCERSDIIEDVDELFSRGYVIPSLPQALIKDVEQGILHKFGPHCSNRQILIEAVAFDLIDKYNLLWVLMYKETQKSFLERRLHMTSCGVETHPVFRCAELSESTPLSISKLEYDIKWLDGSKGDQCR